MKVTFLPEDVTAVLLHSGDWNHVDPGSFQHQASGLLGGQMYEGYVWTYAGRNYACSIAAIVAVQYM